MTDKPEWEPVTIVSRRAVSSSPGSYVTIEWILGGGFSREWAQVWRPTGTRTGSGRFMRGEAPRADMNNVVIWSVPEADMASADFYVKQSVEATNQAYRALIARNEKLEREGQEQEQAAAAHLEELQRKLDDLA
jgi:hypothetical protein